MPANEQQWHERSFLLEIKPKIEYASLFVDCPPPVAPTPISPSLAPSLLFHHVAEAAEVAADIVGNDDGDDDVVEAEMIPPPHHHKLRSGGGQSPSEMVKVGEQTIEVIENGELYAENGDFRGALRRFSARLADVVVDPSTVCALSWADSTKRLFMCKVKAEADGVPFYAKPLSRFEEELASARSLRHYVDAVDGHHFAVHCRACKHPLHSHSAGGPLTLAHLPNDDWLESGGGGGGAEEFFCSMSCGHGHGNRAPAAHSIGGLLSFQPQSSATTMSGTAAGAKWLPSEERVVLTNSFVWLKESETLRRTTNVGESDTPSDGYAMKPRIISCVNCSAQLGIKVKNHEGVYKLHASAAKVLAGEPRESYLKTRFGSWERYFAWLLLNRSEAQSSMKLLLRSYDRQPHLLIWLLEPYVVFTKGTLRQQPQRNGGGGAGAAKGRAKAAPKVSPSGSTSSSSSSSGGSTSSSSGGEDDQDDSTFISFPALKVLYKIFDENSVANDPRANGGDSSVGIVDVPRGCCLALTETLLASSHALPPPFRAVGQFYVGFLRLKDRVD